MTSYGRRKRHGSAADGRRRHAMGRRAALRPRSHRAVADDDRRSDRQAAAAGAVSRRLLGRASAPASGGRVARRRVVGRAGRRRSATGPRRRSWDLLPRARRPRSTSPARRRPAAHPTLPAIRLAPRRHLPRLGGHGRPRRSDDDVRAHAPGPRLAACGRAALEDVIGRMERLRRLRSLRRPPVASPSIHASTGRRRCGGCSTRSPAPARPTCAASWRSSSSSCATTTGCHGRTPTSRSAASWWTSTGQSPSLVVETDGYAYHSTRQRSSATGSGTST